MTTKRNMMSANQLVAVTRYLDQHRETLEGMPRDTLIATIKHATGIEVTDSNLRRIRDIEGFEWVYQLRRTPRDPQDPPTPRDIVMADALVTLYQKLGEAPPEALTAIAQEEA